MMFRAQKNYTLGHFHYLSQKQKNGGLLICQLKLKNNFHTFEPPGEEEQGGG